MEGKRKGDAINANDIPNVEWRCYTRLGRATVRPIWYNWVCTSQLVPSSSTFVVRCYVPVTMPQQTNRTVVPQLNERFRKHRHSHESSWGNLFLCTFYRTSQYHSSHPHAVLVRRSVAIISGNELFIYFY